MGIYLVNCRPASGRQRMRKSSAVVEFVFATKRQTFVAVVVAVIAVVDVVGERRQQLQLRTQHRDVVDPWRAVHRMTVAVGQPHRVGERVETSMKLCKQKKNIITKRRCNKKMKMLTMLLR